MPWDVIDKSGSIYLPQINWWLDAHFPVERSFVSHAHFDHLGAHKEILCSDGTAKLMQARMPGERRELILPYEQPHELTAGCTVRLYPAGHIFGSAQFHATSERGTLLYTGDFKLRQGLSAEPCATPQADTLIMETTFGLPKYVFPPTEKVVADIVAFCQQALHEDAIPVLFGYSLGKSQELLQAIGRAGLPAMLHPQTHKLTKVYEQLGMHFPGHAIFDAAHAGGHVIIAPPQSVNWTPFRKLENKRTAMITGWAVDSSAMYRYQCDAAFALSDHADYPDLLEFVDRVKPQRVFTLHGFAKEFAQTLRERGIEAWAVGQVNQLELGMGISVGSALRPDSGEHKKRANQSGHEASPADELARAADSFARFAETAAKVGTTASKLVKIDVLQNYFASLPVEIAALAAVYFTGRAFAQADARTLNTGVALLRRAIIATAGTNEGAFRAAYSQFRDTGDATAALLAQRIPGGEHVVLPELSTTFAKLAIDRGPSEKISTLQNFFARLTAEEAKYAVKIITGDLRIGLKEGLVEEAIAKATGRTLDAVRAANLLCGDLGQVYIAAAENRLDQIELVPFRPLQFMLASPEPTADAILERLAPPVWLEEKYDGIRCQLHKVGSRVQLYSRDLHNITAQFPDLAASAASLGCDFIADGELLAWRDGRALPFAELQKRLGRKGDDLFLGGEIPVSFSAYDLLWLDGHILLKEPLRERRRHLEAIVPATHPKLHVAPITQASTAIEIEAAFLRARERGNEGLMAKDPASFYTPGRRGQAWLKLKKAYATLDVVVVAVEYGHGKRRDVLSDYTFAIRDTTSDRLLTVGKAYSGLTDVEIAQLTTHFLDHTLEERGRLRYVQPDTVLEIAFDSIQPSTRHQSGYALRFPRIARIRTDKTPTEIDTLDTCRKLAGAPPAGSA
ncbi:ATP-dependent DNA ligase [Oleiharenicola lentus]|uniref:ATP-dependent DNA ligase n=1 Tax=Oleiharenicola lentus TaxID=2508720 RepID=UPI003F674534